MNLFGDYPLDAGGRIATWGSTANFLQMRGCYHKDTLLVVNDFKPEVARHAEAGDEDTIQSPERRAGGHNQRGRDPDRSANRGKLGKQHCAKRQRRGERDVDLAKDDDHRKPNGEDARKHELPR